MKIIKREDHGFPEMVDNYIVHEANEDLKEFPSEVYEFRGVIYLGNGEKRFTETVGRNDLMLLVESLDEKCNDYFRVIQILVNDKWKKYSVMFPYS
jgi:hypothetical protein